MEKFEQPKPFEQRPDDVGGGNIEQTENVEGGLSFEWGPELGDMSWSDAQEKIAELNKTLKEGEKLWRLPTKEEWEEVLKPFNEAQEKDVSEEDLKKIIEDIRKTNNLQLDGYWSSTPFSSDYKGYAWFVIIHSYACYVGNDYHNRGVDHFLVRCVR